MYEHIKLLMEKLKISEAEAGKLLDVSEEELLIWKKYQTLSRTSKAFVEELKSVVLPEV